MQRAFWQKRASMAFLERPAGWRFDRVTVFRAVPLNQPPAVDMLFGDLSCQCVVVIVRPSARWSLRNRRAECVRRQWRSIDSDSRDAGATIKCFACLACVDVAVVRGLNCQVKCHVVKLEVCMLCRAYSERRFVCYLALYKGNNLWHLKISGDILKCKMDPLSVPGRHFQISKARDAAVGVLTFGGSVLPRGRLRKRRRCRRKERSAAAWSFLSYQPRSNPGDIGKQLDCEANRLMKLEHTRGS